MFAKRLSLTATAVVVTAVVVTAVVVTAVVVTVAISIAATTAGGASPAHAAKLRPVVIHETSTPLPCSGAPGHRTTLQMQGCAEKQILKSDTQIDLLEAQIFPILFDDRARRDFNAAQHAWLSYREADCLSMSELFEGGTEAGVADSQCVASRNNQRLKDLRTFHRNLLQTG